MQKLRKFICIILIALTILLSPIITIYMYGKVQNSRIRNDVFEYVLENKDTIELKNKNESEELNLPQLDCPLAVLSMDITIRRTMTIP